MLVRIWTVDIAPGKKEALEQFANHISLPMFKKQPGCLGVLFTKHDEKCATITFWQDEQSIEALAQSENYLDVVAQIEQSDILGGNPHTVIYESFGGSLNNQALLAA